MEFEEGKNDEISFKEIISKIGGWTSFLISQWIKLSVAAIAGAAIGFVWAVSIPVTYSARLTFVVEENKSGAGGLASLVGQFGIDVPGSGGGGSGLLSGENLLLFLKSTSLTKETLLTAYDSAKNYSLADKYADVYHLRKKWASNKKIGREIYFPVITEQPFTRLQDSLIQTIVTVILKKGLIVERPEKKATFVNVEATMMDELLSKYYCERLVQKATDRYVQSKIRRQKANVDRLQAKADSIYAALNNKTYNNASDLEKVLDVNPGERTVTVKAEVSSRDKVMLVTIYGEVAKNLEIAKVQLTQETPTIQIVDDIDLPLNVVKRSKLLFLIVGGFFGVFVVMSFLGAKWLIKTKINN